MHTICYMILSCEFIQQLIYQHIKVKNHEHSLVTNFFSKVTAFQNTVSDYAQGFICAFKKMQACLLVFPQNSRNSLLAAICSLIFYFLFLSSADAFSNDFVVLCRLFLQTTFWTVHNEDLLSGTY